MENQFLYTLLIPALPFLSFLLLALAGKKMSHRAAGVIGTSSLGVVMALAYYTAYQYFTLPRTAEGIYQALVPFNVTWLPLGTLHFDMGILLDPISVMMLIVITTVSFMVHIYSFGYMHGERGFQRYYAFLSLFTMSMLGLVIATNIFQMYLFWELVGVSSYLLIGFYYTQKAAIAASKKAFIVTRFADLFFLIGILIFGYYAKTFNFDFTIENNVREFAGAAFMLPTALILMFIGGAGKSAMFPLVARCYGRPNASRCLNSRGDYGRSRSLPSGSYVPTVDHICSGNFAYRRLDWGIDSLLCRGSSLCAKRH